MKALRGWGAAVIAAVLLGAGCTGDPSTPPVPPVTTTASPPAASVRLHATLLQYRPDEGTNRLEVEFTNEGRDPVTVRSVRISWADARGAPRTPKDTTYAPGQTIDLTTTYGVAVCDQPRPIEPPHAVATLDDGSTIDVALDRHGSDMLKRSHAHDCALQRLSDTASVSLSTTFRRVHLNGEDYLSGNLLLRRPAGRAGTSGDAVTVSDLTGSALLTFVAPPSQPLPATLRPGEPQLDVPVLIGSTYRCDDHGRSQSTQTFLLSAYVRLGDDGAQHRVIVVPDARVRAQAQALMDRACR